MQYLNCSEMPRLCCIWLRYKHWDDFEHLKEGISKYMPGKLGLGDLMLYCTAAFCVLLSMFGVLPSWVSCTAIFALPHYISDACTLEMITLKLVMATFEWKLLAAHNVLYVEHELCFARNDRVPPLYLHWKRLLCHADRASHCNLDDALSSMQPSGSVLGCQTFFVISGLSVCGSDFSLDFCLYPAWTL
eukprot:COSAG02_NODE_1380_length_12986_cov_13.843563_4_plen_189_part_00